ncbi:MAG: AraC family transcriptional regulator [Caulobacter sp.]|nr:AraC family transcriptional regulator [Caulobacter sp.]
MKNSDITATQDSGRSLIFEPAPADLTPFVSAFVCRDDTAAGGVVRFLPEVRGSIQIMLADPVWQRDAETGAPWTAAPRIGLWGPRYSWCYGFAARHIRAYAVGLTYAGLRAITRTPTARIVDQILPLEACRPDLARSLAPLAGEPFPAWRRRAETRLREVFAAETAEGPEAEALDILATFDGGAVARAASVSGLSERQFRRRFQDAVGVPPKLYQRALRIDRMVRRIHVAPWETDSFGDAPIPFADQPHAIREFRAMTGISPGAYLRASRAGGRTLRSVRVDGVDGPPEA